MSTTQIFLTHDNGGRPFRVEINENKVEVFTTEDDKCVLTVTAQKVFIGESLHKVEHTIRYYGPEFSGNSILLQLSPNVYQFIGHIIFTFYTQHEIVDFVSPVGNSDVPYPYAKDSEGNTYLMLEHIVMKNNDVMHTFGDPYLYYYKATNITDDIRFLTPKPPMYPDCPGCDVKQFFIGKNQYTLCYEPFPDQTYKKRTCIVDSHNNKKRLTRESYCQIMKTFGKHIGVEAVPYTLNVERQW